MSRRTGSQCTTENPELGLGGLQLTSDHSSECCSRVSLQCENHSSTNGMNVTNRLTYIVYRANSYRVCHTSPQRCEALDITRTFFLEWREGIVVQYLRDTLVYLVKRLPWLTKPRNFPLMLKHPTPRWTDCSLHHAPLAFDTFSGFE